MDFSAADDTIYLDQGVFAGVLAAAALKLGATTLHADVASSAMSRTVGSSTIPMVPERRPRSCSQR